MAWLLLVLDVRDEADATGVVFDGGVVKPLSLGWARGSIVHS